MTDRSFCCRRSLRPVALGCSLALIAVIAIAAPGHANAQTPSPAAALRLAPVQSNAVIEQVPADLVQQCKVRDIESDDANGWEVLGPDGAMLRRFADTNGDKKIDIWSYYNYGIETYRDVDSDGNGKADQYRWLGSSGTRWGLDPNEDGEIDRWKRISAEEVTAEVVAAIRDRDTRRFVRLLVTPQELESLGLGQSKLAELENKTQLAARNFAALAQNQTAIDGNAKWLQFAAPAPGLVPEGTSGSTQDVLVYENVVAMFDSGDQSGQLMVGTLVKVDDRWRMIGLPNVSTTDGAVTETGGIFFASAGNRTGSNAPAADSQIQSLVTQLEALDAKLAQSDAASMPKLHAARADLVEKLIDASGNEEDRATWTRQLIDTVSVAVQSGQYPDGLSRLKRVANRFASDDRALAAYADYQAIQAEYVIRGTPDADFEEVQKWFLRSLSGFVDDHPRSMEAAQAMLQLALSKEFEGDEKAALAYYKKVSEVYGNTEAAEKAAGAVNRLESVGKRIELAGKTIDGKTFRLSQLRGKPVVIHYWATWCEPCKQDMKLLSRLAAKYRRAGLTLVGVNLDARRADAQAYISESRLPWIQLFEEGGLESSPLSKQFGVQTLPTMMLVDKTGKVVRHNVPSAELASAIEGMMQ